MKKVKHVDTLLRSYPGAMSKKECAELLDYVLYLRKLNIGGDRHDSRTKDRQVASTASPNTFGEALKNAGADMRELPQLNLRSSMVSQQILHVVNQGVYRYAHELGLTTQMPELHTMDVLIQTSNADTFDQYAMWHSEAGELSNCDRAMAWMIYLNDDFKGGETEFKFQKHREKPETGKLVIWPASFTHTHRGGMILEGVKHIATGWVHYGGGRVPESKI